MIGMNFQTTTTLTMILKVLVISLLLCQTEAILGKETHDEYNKGYYPLRNKQPYQEHHQHNPYSPTPRYGYSKPYPKPRETPCSCKKTFFVPVAELKSFQEHWISASLMGCTLATGSSKDELREIKRVAIDFQAEDPNALEDPLMWIGLATEPTTSAPNTDVGGDFGWIDGCTPYTKNVFAEIDEDNEDGFFYLGVIAFDDFHGFEAGDISYLPSTASQVGMPTIYECCVGNKSYRPQTYVLGSPHKTKKKIIHAQSPYIP